MGMVPSLKSKSGSKGVFLALALLVGGGAVGWKMYGHKLVGGSHAVTASDPNRRFFVYVKSDPEGANIYRADGHKLMGATPITLPSSVCPFGHPSADREARLRTL